VTTAAPSLHLHPILSLQDDYLYPWLDLYEAAFPPVERIPVSLMLRGIRQYDLGQMPRSEYLAAVDAQGQFVGMVQWTWYPEYGTAYLGYFAIIPGQRGGGLGSQVYRMLIDRAAQRGALLLAFDVEQPDRQAAPAAHDLALRRIRFYQRKGAGLLSGLEFFYGEPPMQQYVMAHPIQALSFDEILQRVRGVVASFGGWLKETRPDTPFELVFDRP